MVEFSVEYAHVQKCIYIYKHISSGTEDLFLFNDLKVLIISSSVIGALSSSQFKLVVMPSRNEESKCFANDSRLNNNYKKINSLSIKTSL